MSMKAKLHFAVPVRTISVPEPGKEPADYSAFEVRGLTLQDLSHVMQKHGPTLAVLYAKYAKGDIRVDQGMSDAAISTLVTEVPELFASIVARASRGVVDPATAIELPLPVMTDAVMAIGQLTFAGEGALEKFLAAATNMLDGFATVVTKTLTPTPSGSGS